MEVGYPFGHGLSYTVFEHSHLRTEVRGSDEQLEIDVTVTVTNTGTRDGRDVVQVYDEAPSAKVRRPVRELRAFAPAEVAAGESRAVTLTLTWRDLAYFHPVFRQWYVESGTVGIHVGHSSRDLPLATGVDVRVTEPVRPLHRDSTIGECMAHPRGGRILASFLEQKLGESEMSRTLSDPEVLARYASIPLSRIGSFPGTGLTEQALDALISKANA
ncbi:fibronectin type III-like domain-contianing protein [Streptomyces sp. TE33382]